MSQELLTAEEVARLLRVQKSTVYSMIKRGEIPSRKIGKQLRVPAQLLQERLGTLPAAPAEDLPSRRQEGRGLILCGQDVALDCIVDHFRGADGMPPILRSQSGSYNGLVQLYRGEADIATAHLWDGRTGQYNLPYIRALLPGMAATAVRLFGRTTGLYVEKGNPKHLSGWDDLARPGLRLANRERGSGARVLLDEKLRALGISPAGLEGYGREFSSHLLVAEAVAAGEADVGVGSEKGALQFPGVDFLPMQLEWYDMVLPGGHPHREAMEEIIAYIRGGEFSAALSRMGGYDLSRTGETVLI